MKFLSTDLWDDHPNLVRGIEPLFANFGDEVCFGGEIVTVKEMAGTPVQGEVTLSDTEASMRRVLLGDMIAETAVKKRWARMPSLPLHQGCGCHPRPGFLRTGDWEDSFEESDALDW